MGKCSNCGQRTFFAEKMYCRICGKMLCEKCAVYMFKVWSPQRIILDKWYACSHLCLEKFSNMIINSLNAADVGSIDFLPHAMSTLVKHTLSCMQQDSIVNFAPVGELDYDPRGNHLWMMLLPRIQEKLDSMQLSNWMVAGNFEEAAKYYEKRGMYAEAGKTRAKARETVVKNTNVNVDLNALLRQIADGGIVAVYRCPHCGAKLKVAKETTADSLKTCEHCSSEIETMDMVDFLKTALS